MSDLLACSARRSRVRVRHEKAGSLGGDRGNGRGRGRGNSHGGPTLPVGITVGAALAPRMVCRWSDWVWRRPYYV